jgi:3-hydroxyisobutyrate dehydrogenase-like beta-hydroxyacid dehydrogenase
MGTEGAAGGTPANAGGAGAETVGFIGLGIMGKPMAHRLLAAGYPLVVQSRSQGRSEERRVGTEC